MARALQRGEIKELAEAVRSFLAALDAGELDSSPSYRTRLEGALAALEAVLGTRSSLDN